MGEQMLPSFYAEDLMNVMNRERRRESMSKFVGIVKADIERERKGKAGVENLAKALQVKFKLIFNFIKTEKSLLLHV